MGTESENDTVKEHDLGGSAVATRMPAMARMHFPQRMMADPAQERFSPGSGDRMQLPPDRTVGFG